MAPKFLTETMDTHGEPHNVSCSPFQKSLNLEHDAQNFNQVWLADLENSYEQREIDGIEKPVREVGRLKKVLAEAQPAKRRGRPKKKNSCAVLVSILICQ